MGFVLSTHAIKKAEREFCIANNVGEEFLIERAGMCLYEHIDSRFNSGKENEKIIVVCGAGNNGKDGIALHDNLIKNGYFSQLFVIGSQTTIPDFSSYSVIVDCIFGTGLSRKVEGIYYTIIEKINSSNAYKISADIPSGLDAESGAVLGACVAADETVTFIAYKAGLLTNCAKEYTGKITLYSLGVEIFSNLFVFSESDFTPQKRIKNTHKYDYGVVKIIAGSLLMPGAALLSHEAARSTLKSGAGIAVLCVPVCLKNAVLAHIKEETLYLLKSDENSFIFDETDFKNIINKADVICIGMGMPPNGELYKAIKYLFENFSGTVIADAGAITVMAQYRELMTAKRKCGLILSPHAGEFARLTLTAKVITYKEVIDVAKEMNAVIIYKGAVSIITNGIKTAFNLTGTPALAKGGSGDVLSGMLAAFAYSYKDDLFFAAARAVHLHGLLGERAEKEFGENCVLSSDLIKFI